MPRIRRFVQVQTSGAKARNFQSLTAGLKACSTLGLTGSAEEMPRLRRLFMEVIGSLCGKIAARFTALKQTQDPSALLTR